MLQVTNTVGGICNTMFNMLHFYPRPTGLPVGYTMLPMSPTRLPASETRGVGFQFVSVSSAHGGSNTMGRVSPVVVTTWWYL